jgi:hypothetical protein
VIDRKIEALLCHRSQVGDDAERISTWLREVTAAAGAPQGLAHAETFQVIAQGPGFHDEEVEDDADAGLARPSPDPAAARVMRTDTPGGK